MFVRRFKAFVRKWLSIAFLASICTPSVFAADVAISCSGRDTPAAKNLGSGLSADPLLDSAMEGKKYTLNPGASLVSMEATLVQYYGLRQSVRSIPDDSGRVAMQRVATLVENNYAIAAQMALGSSVSRGLIPPPLSGYLLRYVMNLTEPYHDDPELLDVKAKGEAGQRSVAQMSVKVRSFARWAVLGSAWDDQVAVDASLSGFCMSSPTKEDLKLLNVGMRVARLDKSKSYGEPGTQSFGIPVPQSKR